MRVICLCQKRLDIRKAELRLIREPSSSVVDLHAYLLWQRSEEDLAIQTAPLAVPVGDRVEQSAANILLDSGLMRVLQERLADGLPGPCVCALPEKSRFTLGSQEVLEAALLEVGAR